MKRKCNLAIFAPLVAATILVLPPGRSFAQAPVVPPNNEDPGKAEGNNDCIVNTVTTTCENASLSVVPGVSPVKCWNPVSVTMNFPFEVTASGNIKITTTYTAGSSCQTTITEPIAEAKCTKWSISGPVMPDGNYFYVEDSGCDPIFTLSNAPPGEYTAKLTAQIGDGCRIVTAELKGYIVKLNVKSVAFSGAGNVYNPVVSDRGVQYDAPHWVDNTVPLDGDAEDKVVANPGQNDPDIKHPVSYVRKTKPFIGATLVTETLLPSTASIRIRGLGPNGLGGAIDIPQTVVAPATQIELPATETTHSFPDTIEYYANFGIRWQVSFDEGATWCEIGKSQNELYVTWADPLEKVFHTLVDIGCKQAQTKGGLAGAIADEKPVVSAIWTEFTDLSVTRVPPKNEVTMSFWMEPPWPGDMDDQVVHTTDDLLSSESGRGACQAWALLFRSCILVQGIKGAGIGTIQLNNNIEIPEGFTPVLLVKNWEFADPQRILPVKVEIPPGSGTFKWQPPLDDRQGISGQGPVQNPPSSFNGHAVVIYEKEIYDPSYGKGPYNGAEFNDDPLLQWQRNSLDGIGLMKEDAVTIQFQIIQLDPNSPKAVTY